MEKWTPLEHQIYRELKALPIQGKKCLLMVSGGADSMALLEIFSKLHSSLDFPVEVLHCHHGPSADSEQQNFRDRALDFVRKAAEIRKIPFHFEKASGELKSEDDFRQFRLAASQKVFEQAHFDWVVTAHHQEDLLETQILRLIRGAGPQFAVEPMQYAHNHFLRPFLSVSREQIISYLTNQNLEYLNDPSNEDQNFLRNWIRRTWLPQLEEKCPGALRSFARSLDLIRDSLSESFSEEIWSENGLSRPVFLTLSEAQKRQVLALYLRRCGQNEFTHNQIKEILKHLDISQLNHSFRAAQLQWHLSKDLIYAKPAHVVNAD